LINVLKIELARPLGHDGSAALNCSYWMKLRQNHQNYRTVINSGSRFNRLNRLVWFLKYYQSDKIEFLNLENATFAIPDQVVGIYFGWAKVDSDRKFKILVSINLDFSSVAYKKIVSTSQLYNSTIPSFIL